MLILVPPWPGPALNAETLTPYLLSSPLLSRYYKGVGTGVKNWTAMPSIFKGGNAGIRALVDKTGWKIVAHNRYWSANTDYAKVRRKK